MSKEPKASVLLESDPLGMSASSLLICSAPECEYSTSDRSNLRVHEMGHSGELPYQCPYCPHATRDRGNMKVHERVHRDEKPFKCDEVRPQPATHASA